MLKMEERCEGFWKENYTVCDRIYLFGSYGMVQMSALCTCTIGDYYFNLSSIQLNWQTNSPC